MSLLVLLTGGSGLVVSYGLLQAGVTAMWLRYPLALCAAYLVFFVLLWLWLRTKFEDYGDVFTLPSGTSSSSNGGNCASPADFASGRDGDFSGGGASASFDSATPFNTLSAPTADTSPALGDSFSTVGESDEAAIPLLVILVVLGLAMSSLYIVYSAPVLFAELLLDGALSATLYRRLKGLERSHWVETALRRTAMPFLLTAVFLTLSGWALSSYAPNANSIGEVIRHANVHG
jgi:hypothetical protein